MIIPHLEAESRLSRYNEKIFCLHWNYNNGQEENVKTSADEPSASIRDQMLVGIRNLKLLDIAVSSSEVVAKKRTARTQKISAKISVSELGSAPRGGEESYH